MRKVFGGVRLPHVPASAVTLPVTLQSAEDEEILHLSVPFRLAHVEK